jgi:signal transduction histidine kinase
MPRSDRERRKWIRKRSRRGTTGVEAPARKKTAIKEFLLKPGVRLAVLVASVVVILATGATALLTDQEAFESQQWATHSYEVRHQLSNLNVARAEARAAAFGNLPGTDAKRKRDLQQQTAAMRTIVQRLHQLVRDNPVQLERVARIELLVKQQAAELEECVNQKGCGKAVVAAVEQRKIQLDELVTVMDRDEHELLRGRLYEWNALFRRNRIPIAVACGVALFLLFYSFRLLTAEVAARRAMEKQAHENTESYRAMSARILELQDIERRKIARELHDSIGQFLAGVKMGLGQISSKKAMVVEKEWVTETMDMTDKAIGEIRTISHLLHPPLLDELGFEATARWYADGFAKRSGTKIKLDIDEIVDRLPRGVELALFRVLQESLTNVHRHAKAQNVSVQLCCRDGEVILEVRDDGNGIPRRVLQRFQAGGAAGIGLTGMRERLGELDGHLEVESSAAGTRILATVPSKQRDSESATAVSNAN